MKKFNKKDVEDILALTPMQKGMLVHYLKDPQSDIYFEQLKLEIHGKIDFGVFKESWNKVTSYNEMLRTVFIWDEIAEPMQVVLKNHEAEVIIADFINEEEKVIPKLIDEVLRKDRMEKFDLNKVPFRVTICRISDSANIVIISNHHILYDGWSNGILLKEFFSVYDAIYNNKELPMIKKNKYKNYVKFINNSDKGEQRKFWSKYLENVNLNYMNNDSYISKSKKIDIENYVLPIDKHYMSNVANFSKKNGNTLATFFYCMWAIVLYLKDNRNDRLMGTVVSGRDPEVIGIENMVGLFINTVPLRIKIDSKSRILDILDEIQFILAERKEYENNSLVDIKNYCDIKGKDNILNNIVILENYPIQKEAICKNSLLKINAYSIFIRAEFDLMLNISVVSDLETTICYNKKVYNEESIIELGKCFKRVIDLVIDESKNYQLTLSDIEIFSDEKKNEIISIIQDDSDSVNIDFDFDI